EALDALDLVARQADAADDVARLVFVALHQLETNFVEADFVELVEDAEDVDALLGRDARVLEQQVQHRPAGEADEGAADVERLETVAHAGDDLGVGDVGLGADGVEVELRELAEATLVRRVGAPPRPDLGAAEEPRQTWTW